MGEASRTLATGLFVSRNEARARQVPVAYGTFTKQHYGETGQELVAGVLRSGCYYPGSCFTGSQRRARARIAACTIEVFKRTFAQGQYCLGHCTARQDPL